MNTISGVRCWSCKLWVLMTWTSEQNIPFPLIVGVGGELFLWCEWGLWYVRGQWALFVTIILFGVQPWRQRESSPLKSKGQTNGYNQCQQARPSMTFNVLVSISWSPPVFWSRLKSCPSDLSVWMEISKCFTRHSALTDGLGRIFFRLEKQTWFLVHIRC